MSRHTGPRSRGTTPRSTPRSPATRAAAPQGATARGGHVVDLALLFAELLAAPGVTQADLGRRYRKSPGYVSIVCRLGRALRDLPPEARDALRVPHLTLKAAQALVSRHADPVALRDAVIRLAKSSPASPSGDTSRGARARARQGVPSQWDRAPDGPDLIDPLPEPPDAMSRRATFVYAWDAEAARRDPRGVLAEFEAFVRATTDEVVTRLRHATGDAGPPPRPEPDTVGAVDVTASGERVLTGRLEDTALRRLDARVAETLRAHRARMDAFLADRDRVRGREPRPEAPPGTGRGGSLPPLPVDQADLDADLG